MKHFKQKTIALFLGIHLFASVISPVGAIGCRVRTCCPPPTECKRLCTPCGRLYVPSCGESDAYIGGVPAELIDAVPSAEPELPGIVAEPESPSVEIPPEEIAAPEADAVLAFEREVVALVNEQRAAYGLAAVELSAELCQKARIKSQDMADNRYFSHDSPTYGSPFDMMNALGITYRTAGENIAMGYSTPVAVVDAWMHSEGHRANILNASYRALGVGYVADGNYWTQWFIG